MKSSRGRKNVNRKIAQMRNADCGIRIEEQRLKMATEGMKRGKGNTKVRKVNRLGGLLEQAVRLLGDLMQAVLEEESLLFLSLIHI